MPDPKGFALACQQDKGLSAEVDYMALRRNEDLLAARTLGVEPLWLPFAEAPHRGYGSAAELFGAVRPEDAIGADLAAAFAALLANHRPVLVLGPQAIGGHVDHVQVFSALASLRAECPILWWRDFPYVVRDATPREPFGDEVAGLPDKAIALGAEAQRRKREACRCYASQLGFQFGGFDELDRKLAQSGAVELFKTTGSAEDLLS